MEYMIHFIKYICYGTNDSPLRWRSGLERNSCGRLGVQIRAATDLSRVSSTAKRSEIGASVTLPRRWQTSLLNGHEYRAWVIICSPSPIMVTSPNEWKILEWYEKHRQTQPPSLIVDWSMTYILFDLFFFFAFLISEIFSIIQLKKLY